MGPGGGREDDGDGEGGRRKGNRLSNLTEKMSRIEPLESQGTRRSFEYAGPFHSKFKSKFQPHAPPTSHHTTCSHTRSRTHARPKTHSLVGQYCAAGTAQVETGERSVDGHNVCGGFFNKLFRNTDQIFVRRVLRGSARDALARSVGWRAALRASFSCILQGRHGRCTRLSRVCVFS